LIGLSGIGLSGIGLSGSARRGSACRDRISAFARARCAREGPVVKIIDAKSLDIKISVQAQYLDIEILER
jgi:hypothetical protein